MTSREYHYHQQRKCNGCKKRFPKVQLQKCENDEEIEHLCDNCNDGTWYCMACGRFCAGITSFDFGIHKGFCDNCADQIQDDENNYFNEGDCYDGGEYSGDDSPELTDDDAFAWECCGCMVSQTNPGPCNICGNPTDPMYF